MNLGKKPQTSALGFCPAQSVIEPLNHRTTESFWTHYCYCCFLVRFIKFFLFIQPTNSLLFLSLPYFLRGGGR